MTQNVNIESKRHHAAQEKLRKEKMEKSLKSEQLCDKLPPEQKEPN